MNASQPGLTLDSLFVGATRPPMRWGVTYTALLANMVITMEAFLLTKNLLVLTLYMPLHGLSALLCARDARIFELVVLWARMRVPMLLGNYRMWKAGSYSPLSLDLPNANGRRRAIPWVRR